MLLVGRVSVQFINELDKDRDKEVGTIALSQSSGMRQRNLPAYLGPKVPLERIASFLSARLA